MFRKLKLFLTCLLIVSSFSLAPVFALASTPAPTPIPAVNSFELLWPMVAGKTEADSMYSLKLLKEKIRGKLIFSEAPKADYAIFIATKRLLEAEKLLQMDKKDLADKALIRAQIEFKLVPNVQIITSISLDRLKADKTLVIYLNSKYPNDHLTEISKSLSQLLP